MIALWILLTLSCEPVDSPPVDLMAALSTRELPLTTEPEFLYTVLGGRISPEARYHAVIGPQGDVRFDLVKP